MKQILIKVSSVSASICYNLICEYFLVAQIGLIIYLIVLSKYIQIVEIVLLNLRKSFSFISSISKHIIIVWKKTCSLIPNQAFLFIYLFLYKPFEKKIVLISCYYLKTKSKKFLMHWIAQCD